MPLERKIKLIWDFRGAMASQAAERHEKYLKEYIAVSGLPLHITGHKHLSDRHCISFMIIEEKQMAKAKNILRPHRGEIYEDRPKQNQI